MRMANHKQGNRKTRWISLVLAAALMVSGIIGIVRFFGDKDLPPGEPIERPLPTVGLFTLDGQPYDLGELAGDRVLLNFWATWCPPCLEEMPALEAFDQMWRDQGIRVVAVNDGESPKEVQSFVHEHDLSMLVLLDPEMKLATELDINYLPTTLFVSEQGVIRSQWAGVLQHKEMVAGARALGSAR